MKKILLSVLSLIGVSASAQYCLPTYNNDCTSGDYIENVVFNTISNLGTACANTVSANYSDYTSLSAVVSPGLSYNIDVTPGPTWEQYFVAFADFNQDGDFADPNEFFDIGFAPAGTTISGSITIPGGATAGNTTLRVMCRYGTTPLTHADSCAIGLSYGEIEDYTITVVPPAPYEASAGSIDAPMTGCGLGMETVIATFNNNGTSTADTVDLCYSVNGGAWVCESFTNLGVASGASYQHSFATLLDMSTPGTYSIDFAVSLSGDTLNINDTIFGYTIQSIPTISTVPYSEDFEAGMGGWVGNGDWQHGVPAGPTINSISACATGSNVWMTNLTGPYSNNAFFVLESPCIDFGSLTSDPVISFDLYYDFENCCDEAYMEISFDGGNTWTKLGSGLSGVNWYNDFGSEEWNGANSGWVKAAHELTGAAGQSSVRLRYVIESDGSVTNDGIAIDNINIDNNALFDASVVSLDGPQSSCGLTAADSVSATFVANGLDTIVGFDVCYTINGGTQICENVNDTLFPGIPYAYTFSTTADFSATGDYNVDINISVIGDLDTCNNILSTIVSNKPLVNSYPYFENFENGTGGWAADNGANGTWELATPNNTVINGAASGTNAWVTNATGNYNNNDNSSVYGPCFDFTSLPTGSWVVMKTWWDSENSWDGANLQLSVDGINWVNIGAFGDPDNWYTDNSISGSPGGSQEGWTGTTFNNGSNGWVISKHALDDTLIGYANVEIRVNFGSDGSVQEEGFAFDDFGIGVPPTVDIGADFTGCGSYQVTLSGEGTFEWFGQDTAMVNPPVLFNTGSTGTFPNTGSTDTTYYGIVVFTDTIGLCASDTALLTLNPAPYNQLPDTVVCPGDTTWFYADADPNHLYNWSNFLTTDSSAFIFSPNTTGGMVIVTTTNFTNNCAHTDTAMVMQTPVVSINDTAFCAGGSVMMDAGMDYMMWNWSNGDSTQMSNVSTSGMISVTVTDGIGCVSMDSAMVTSNAVPTPSITGASDTLCSLSSFTLDAGSFASYMWSTGGTAQTESVDGPTLGLGTQTVTVTVMDANGCAGMDSVTFEVVQCTSIDENELNLVSVYPNPTNGLFTIELMNAGQISLLLTDAQGKIITSRTIQQTENIDITELETGIYFLTVSNDQGEQVLRIVKN